MSKYINEINVAVKSTKGDKVNNVRVSLYYSLGGINYFTYKNEPRGYYVSVSPEYVEHKDGYTATEYRAFSGFKDVLVECTRQSKARAEEAKEIFNERLNEYVDYICKHDGLERV